VLKRGKFEEICINVEEESKPYVVGKLKSEIKYIVDFFKKLKELGEINSIWRPKNKKLQKEIDKLVDIKKKLKQDIRKMNIIFA